MLDKKWIKTTALALSLPTTIFVSAVVFMKLAEQNIISESVAIILFLFIVLDILFLMVWHAYKRKS